MLFCVDMKIKSKLVLLTNIACCQCLCLVAAAAVYLHANYSGDAVRYNFDV